jgi:hypothetical protein
MSQLLAWFPGDTLSQGPRINQLGRVSGAHFLGTKDGDLCVTRCLGCNVLTPVGQSCTALGWCPSCPQDRRHPVSSGQAVTVHLGLDYVPIPWSHLGVI